MGHSRGRCGKRPRTQPFITVPLKGAAAAKMKTMANANAKWRAEERRGIKVVGKNHATIVLRHLSCSYGNEYRELTQAAQ
mmetsp:Transcript_23854/g.44075  ORF Transcript_23854/g.44075 Transcript_23854/m.44075 type:complete len:80 (-) Transcript_23854:184-423(-)